MKKYIVYASKETVTVNYAKFSIMASSEKEAETNVKDRLNSTCLADRLRETNNDTEVKEGKIGVFAEEVDEVNENDLKGIEELSLDD